MSTPVRVVAFVATLAVVFGAALGIGYAVGPVADEPPAHDQPHDTGHGDDPIVLSPAGEDGGHGHGAEEAAALPGGLLVSQDGYTLRLADPAVRAGSGVPVSLTIEGPDGEPLTAYEEAHEKELHLIAVRRDAIGFQHVHPTRDADGTWHTRLDLTGGSWRVFADFKPADGEALTLGVDLAVVGTFRPAEPTAVSRAAHVDGYHVTLDGDLTAGSDGELTLTVTKDGEPVTDLQPYLGAYGHLVALRSGDLAYLHVHPDGAPGDPGIEPGPEVVFHANAPSAGTYHLFLDFRHDGEVRTAGFTVHAGAGAAGDHGDGHSPDTDDAPEEDEHGDDHAH